MPKINFSNRTLTCKIVYYGPGLSGKTSNLEFIYGQLPKERRGELTSISTHGDRTIFYDFLPVELGAVAGLTTRLQLFTVPGQTYYAATRKLVLVGVDGVVFVADSQRERLQENLESYDEMSAVLAEQHKNLALLPHIVQYNKRDLPGVLDATELDRVINRHRVPSFETVASRGDGVLASLRCLSRLVLQEAKSEYGAPIPGASQVAERAPEPIVPQPLPPGPPRRPKSARRAPPAPPPAPRRPRKKPKTQKLSPPADVVPELAELAESAEETRPFGVRRKPLDSADMLTREGGMSIPLESLDEESPPEEDEGYAIGKTVGGCVILAKLGEGGMGAVYLARHKALGKDFVVKTLKPERQENKTSVKRFFAEARATARLEHENVVRVQDVGTTKQGMHYMIMQYVDGQNLEDKVRQEGALAPTESARIVLEVAKALEATHSAGVIHRDVKPQNVIVTGDGHVKLIDFGLARDVANRQRLTRQGGLVGTPAYMAPEMITGQGEIDGRVDLFALGLTFYFLLTGETPFLGTDIHDLFLGKARLKPPEVFVAALPEGYKIVIERMLAKERDSRYVSATELVRDLALLLAGKAPPITGERAFWLWAEPSSEDASLPQVVVGKLGATTAEITIPTGDSSVDASAGNPLVREIERATRDPANHVEHCITLNVIDSSPFGRVYRAWDTQETRLVALRVIDGFKRLDKKTRAYLTKATQVQHASLPPLHRFGVSDEGELFMVHQLVRGRSLFSYRFKPKQVVMAMRDVARAVHAANKQGLIHGNLQPASVLIDTASMGHLLDLGLAGAFHRQGATDAGHIPRISSRFYAPECLNSLGDKRSEVYALGATFYYGLTRQPPGTGSIVPPRQLRGGIPTPVQEICLRCLNQAPADRYQSAGELASAINDFLRTKPRKRK